MNAAAPHPRLRADVTIIERAYRGETSYLAKDPAAQRYFRFGKAEVTTMRRFDGHHSAAAITGALAGEGIRLSVAAVERFARQLASAGLLERTLGEKSLLQLERLRAERRTRARKPLARGGLLRRRWTFGDPDAVLGRVLPRIRWMFTPAFVAATLVLFAIYLLLLGQHWAEFTAAVQSTYAPRHLTLGRALTLWATGGAVMLIHELGHGFTCKHFGGEVRELGFMMLYCQPAFYCNVNDAWSFPQRRARLWVTAAGSWIQLVVTALATLAWLVVRPGTFVADVAVATMLIGGVTALFANLNPLLPLDGYFALMDWLEIPNLRRRALAQVSWWIQRRVCRLHLPEPLATVRERRVFLTYGVLASLYLAVLFGSLAALALGWMRQAFGGMGAAAGLAGLLLLLRARIREWGRIIAQSFRARRAAWRASPRRRIAFVALVLLAVAAFLPWPLTSVGTFVIRPATSVTITAPESAVVAQVFVVEGARVAAGAPIVRLVDHDLDRSILAAARSTDSCAVAETAARARGRTGEAERLAAERVAAAARLAALEIRGRSLTIRAVASGVVVSPRPEDLVGRRVAAGDSLVLVASIDSVEARVSLDAGGATHVHAGQRVRLVSYADVSAPWTARITSVAVAGNAATKIEARVRGGADAGWRPGATGEAIVEVARSNGFGALWWKARQLVRGDLWL